MRIFLKNMVDRSGGQPAKNDDLFAKISEQLLSGPGSTQRADDNRELLRELSERLNATGGSAGAVAVPSSINLIVREEQKDKRLCVLDILKAKIDGDRFAKISRAVIFYSKFTNEFVKILYDKSRTVYGILVGKSSQILEDIDSIREELLVADPGNCKAEVCRIYKAHKAWDRLLNPGRQQAGLISMLMDLTAANSEMRAVFGENPIHNVWSELKAAKSFKPYTPIVTASPMTLITFKKRERSNGNDNYKQGGQKRNGGNNNGRFGDNKKNKKV